ncbi:MAG TPA: glycoside hydrolase family 3 protein, partial [Rectinemataceae bacterium]|nr:glycoside hydrolase family 3 protein [Rectinemataceae bacterium]
EGLATLRRTVEATSAGSVILFFRNTPDAETARATVTEARSIIESVTGTAPFIAIDQEGGIVARLSKGVTPIPGAMAQAAACLGGSAGIGDIENLGEECGGDLAALGINWNLAPVADVNVNPNNPVIGVRSYGENPDLVAEFASAFARGLGKSGVMATAKHFPGHGDTTIDSHLDMPLIQHDLARLDKIELLPFRRLIAEEIPAVMTAHIRFPAVEPDPLPATLSPRVVEGLLRGKLGYKGIICTDCMEMKAIADHFKDPYVMAVKAGIDILFISHTPERQIEAAASIYKAVARGEIPESRIDASVARILAYKARYPSRTAALSGERQGARAGAFALSRRISRGSITLLREGGTLDLAEGGVLIDVAPGNLTGAEDTSEAPSIAVELGRMETEWSTLRVSVDPSEAEISGAVEFAESILEQALSLFSRTAAGDGRLEKKAGKRNLALSLVAPFAHRGQIELLTQCASLSARMKAPLLLILMRSPYDATKLVGLSDSETGAEASVIAAYEYTELSAASLAEYLAGGFEARGVCPITLPL